MIVNLNDYFIVKCDWCGKIIKQDKVHTSVVPDSELTKESIEHCCDACFKTLNKLNIHPK